MALPDTGAAHAITHRTCNGPANAMRNCVWYQNLDVAADTIGGNTIPAVGVDLEKVWLGDFKVVSPKGGLTADASTLIQRSPPKVRQMANISTDQALIDAGIDGAAAATIGGVRNWQTVPAPTIGLMLLLGVAGLALRRRRA